MVLIRIVRTNLARLIEGKARLYNTNSRNKFNVAGYIYRRRPHSRWADRGKSDRASMEVEGGKGSDMATDLVVPSPICHVL